MNAELRTAEQSKEREKEDIKRLNAVITSLKQELAEQVCSLTLAIRYSNIWRTNRRALSRTCTYAYASGTQSHTGDGATARARAEFPSARPHSYRRYEAR